MNFDVSEEQELLQAVIREFLERDWPPRATREVIESDTGFDPGLWKGLVELGVLGTHIESEFGGAGLELLDLALVAEVLGYGGMPGPFLGHVLAAMAIQLAGSDDQRRSWLPRLAAGDAIGTVRVVTVRDADLPRPLYALWKLPSPRAMSDNFWQEGSMVAEIADGGLLGRCRIGTGLDGRWIEAHPVSGLRFDSFRVPHFDAALDTANRAHALFPEFGVIGWDIAIGPDGPVIIEANDNPFHGLYQLAYGRGIRNPEFTPVFDRTAERSEAMYARKKELFEARNKAKRRNG